MREKLYYLVGWYRNITFGKKQMITYLAFGLLPILLISALFIARISNQTLQQSTLWMESGLAQSAALLNKTLQQVKETSDSLYVNRTLRDILENEPASLSEQVDHYQQIDTLLSVFQQNQSIHRIRLFVRDGYLYSNQGDITYNMESKMADDAYAAQVDPTGRMRFTPVYAHEYLYRNPRRIFSVTRVLSSLHNLNEPVGLLYIDILEDELLSLLAPNDFQASSMTYIQNGEGALVTRYLGGQLDAAQWEGAIGTIGPDTRRFVNAAGAPAIVRSVYLPLPDWTIYYLLPEQALRRDTQVLQWQMLSMILLISIPSVLLLILLNRTNAKRIRGLATKMIDFGAHEGQEDMTTHSADELGILEHSFATMVRKTRNMLVERYELGKQMEGLELRMLQAQIKPHFLYNTLDMIYWAANRGDMQAVQEILTDLTKYYRLTLRRGTQYASLASEIDLIGRYMRIQNRRFDRQVSLCVEVPEALMETSILCFILQPLVENAFVHGILEKKEADGTIVLSARREESDLLLSVTDNGVGMTARQCRQAAGEGGPPSTPSSYGIRNISDRLQLQHRGNWLRITSELGEYTRVEMRLCDAFPKA